MPAKDDHTLTVESAARLPGIGGARDTRPSTRTIPVNVIQLGGRYLIPRAELQALPGIERLGNEGRAGASQTSSV